MQLIKIQSPLKNLPLPTIRKTTTNHTTRTELSQFQLATAAPRQLFLNRQFQPIAPPRPTAQKATAPSRTNGPRP